MMDSPIDEGDVKSNVPTCFFALDPFVTEYFRSLGAKCLVKPRFHEALRRTLRNNECHEYNFPVELEHLQAKVIHRFEERTDLTVDEVLPARIPRRVFHGLSIFMTFLNRRMISSRTA